MTMMNARTDVTSRTSRDPWRRGRAGRQPSRHRPARPGIHVHACFDIGEPPAGTCARARLDQLGDLDEADPPFEEGGHRHLVGGVEHHRAPPARLERAAREGEAGESIGVRRLEGQRPHPREVEALRRRGQPRRIGEARRGWGCPCRPRRAGRSPSRPRTPPWSARWTAGAPPPARARMGRRRASGPRSPRAPCS